MNIQQHNKLGKWLSKVKLNLKKEKYYKIDTLINKVRCELDNIYFNKFTENSPYYPADKWWRDNEN